MQTTKSATPMLGELEVAVLEQLWSSGEMSAKDMHELISQNRNVSGNSVQSAMDRLYKKALLTRRKLSHRYLYQAEVSKSDLLGDLFNDLVSKFQADSYSSAVAMLSAAERIDKETLDILEAEIKSRRKELQS